MLVYAMLVDLNKRLTPPKSSGNLKEDTEAHWAGLSGLSSNGKGGLTVGEGDSDPSFEGAVLAGKWGSPKVGMGEEACYRGWLKRGGEVDTVIDEVYVRYVGVTQGSRKQWEIREGTGCGGSSELQKRSMEGKDGDGIPDDMEIYHPILNSHVKDPWEEHRRRRAHLNDDGVFVGEFGHRKRSLKETASKDYASGLPSAPSSPSAGSGTASTSISSKPHGFASSVTGGGNLPPSIPRDIKELETFLTDSQPRVIHLNKIYDFRGSAGVCTNCRGCISDSYPKCLSKGQLAIDNGQGWCKGRPPASVTYDKAGLTGIRVGSNKSIIGVSADAGIRGRGLIVAHQKNVIMHNFRIDQINPKYIWGGDAITLYDTDLVWVDKITFSLIGRQHIVTGYKAAGRVTISNCFFDCQTKWSATCDGSHYWTVLGYGTSDKVTFSGNLMKHCSGRSPRIANPSNGGGDSVWHVVNTVFDHSSGHSFDMGPGISALIEGNVFNDVAQTSLHENTPGRAFAPSDAAICKQCRNPLGRDCQPNAYVSAKPIPSTASAGVVLKDMRTEQVAGAMTPGQVAQRITRTAGSSGAKGAGGSLAESKVVIGGEGDGVEGVSAGDRRQIGYSAGAPSAESYGATPYTPGAGQQGGSKGKTPHPGKGAAKDAQQPPQQQQKHPQHEQKKLQEQQQEAEQQHKRQQQEIKKQKEEQLKQKQQAAQQHH